MKTTTLQKTKELQHTVRGFIQSQKQCAAMLRTAADHEQELGHKRSAITLRAVAQKLDEVSNGDQ